MVSNTYQITASTLVSGLGVGLDEHVQALKSHQTGLKNVTTHFDTRLSSFVGEIRDLDFVVLPTSLADYTCRNHQLAWMALNTDGFAEEVECLKKKYGAHRIGLAVGTSTSGILETEIALAAKDKTGAFPEKYHYQTTHEMDALANFCCDALALTGPRMVISTACSSSAKVFASAIRWIEHDLVDAVVVGGVDTLCLTTIHGFNALGLISSEITRPFSANRQGINIGEAGGFAIVERAQADSNKVRLSGFGETSDAYHISTPHPEGKGAQMAMQQALQKANLTPKDIDYLNLHGTGTPSNDLSESKALKSVFTDKLPKLSSTKGFTGHTLGAAGITEAVFCQLALEHQLVFANLNLNAVDEEINLPIEQTTHSYKVKHCMSNSFGFGGNNACLIFSLPGETR